MKFQDSPPNHNGGGYSVEERQLTPRIVAREIGLRHVPQHCDWAWVLNAATDAYWVRRRTQTVEDVA